MPLLTEYHNMTLSNHLSKKRKHSEPTALRQYEQQQHNTPERSPVDAAAPPSSDSHNNGDLAISANAGPTQRKIHVLPPKKRARTALSTQVEPKVQTTTTANTTPRKDLSPCHICHRKPQRKCDLDSYKTCEGCRLRTCYICIRECSGAGRHWIQQLQQAVGNKKAQQSRHPTDGEGEEDAHNQYFEMQDVGNGNNGDENDGDISRPASASDWWRRRREHHPVICSQCCVETGTDGETLCLGCFDSVDEERSKDV